MFSSIRARIIAATTGCLVVALLLNTLINLQVTRLDNRQAQQDTLISTSASHSLAIADWVSGKMNMISSLQQAALNRRSGAGISSNGAGRRLYEYLCRVCQQNSKILRPGRHTARFRSDVTPLVSTGCQR
ncbi:Uncharacterised protein [Citrobacter koseri]|uniref:Methyl-accepting chemotaxis protein n=1 Tax=Citrobacter koseri TaxID=545 RepID=A0A2X2WG25_CITKO|nr:Uncharacterised protein [Citrobacter koseri]